MAAMERRIKTGNLGQLRTARKKRTDWRKVVGLMQWCQRHIALETLEHAPIKQNRPIVFWPAMNNAMTYGDNVEALILAQPTCRLVYCGSDVRHGVARKLFVDEDGLVFRLGTQPRPCANAVHLTLDQPDQACGVVYSKYLKLYARRAGIDHQNCVHDTSRSRQCHRAAARIGIEHCSRARCHAASDRICAGRQNDRDARAQNHARRIGLGKEDEILGEHIAGLQVRDDENLRSARNLRLDSLDLCCRWVDRVVESKRSIKNAIGNLSSIRHLAERRCLDRRWDLRRYRLDGREDCDPRFAETNQCEKVNCILNDVPLGIEIRKDVDRRISDEERLRMARHVHNENVADPPCRSQTGAGTGDCSHELIGMQAALHEQLAFRFMDQLNCFDSGRLAVARVHDLEMIDIEMMLASNRADTRGWADKSWNDNARVGSLYRCAQR